MFLAGCQALPGMLLGETPSCTAMFCVQSAAAGEVYDAEARQARLQKLLWGGSGMLQQ